MKIAFTVCSNNYLSQAKALGDSLNKYNPDYKFFIGLCDKKSKCIDYSIFQSAEIIEVDKLNIENFDWMAGEYDIVEFNTSVKPFYFQYFLKQYQDVEIVMYFDPDILIFDNLTSIEKELHNKSIILTPHILTPMPNDNKKPDESIFLNYGLYNLGFLGLRPTSESMKMLNWWSGKLAIQCFNAPSEGSFVDQLPMNYLPIFYEDVHVSYNMGYNFAYWNFHERTVSEEDGKYYINEKYPLIFFHFSNFKPEYPLKIASYQNRFVLQENSILYQLFSFYADLLIENRYNELIKIPNFYSIKKINKKSFFSKLKVKTIKKSNESFNYYD